MWMCRRLYVDAYMCIRRYRCARMQGFAFILTIAKLLIVFVYVNKNVKGCLVGLKMQKNIQ